MSRRNVTLIDVASRAGVSKSTVSLVLRNDDRVKAETRARVRSAIDALGYVYNRKAAALRSATPDLVGVIVNDFGLSYPALVAASLEAEVFGAGMTPMLAGSSDNLERQSQLVQAYREHNVGGVIMCPAPETDSNWLEGLRRNGCPVVCVMREVAYSKAPVVVADNTAGTRLATEHLLALGHRKIAMLGGQSSTSDFHQRLEGFLSAMRGAGVSVPESWIVPIRQDRDAGQAAMATLRQSHRDVTAVVCFSDVMAYGVYRYCQEQSIRVGRDLAVVGFDDNPDSRLVWPPLTTVRVDAGAIGKAAWQLMEKCLAGGEVDAAREVIDVQLIVRNSCGSQSH